MKSIKIDQLKRNDVVLEQSNYGSDVYVVISDPIKEDNTWYVSLREVKTNAEDTFFANYDYCEAYHPHLYLVLRSF